MPNLLKLTLMITPYLAAKQCRWQELAALTWEEKVAIIEKMRQMLPLHPWRRLTPADTPVAAEANPDHTLASTPSPT